MKYFSLLFLLVGLLTSCSKDEDDTLKPEMSLYGKWTLVKITGSMPSYELTESSLDRYESYNFNEDGTFTKIRVKDNVSTNASGTFLAKVNDGVTYLELTYTSESDLIGSCYGNLKEELYLSDDKITLSSTWKHCDGPGLDYQKNIIY